METGWLSTKEVVCAKLGPQQLVALGFPELVVVFDLLSWKIVCEVKLRGVKRIVWGNEEVYLAGDSLWSCNLKSPPKLLRSSKVKDLCWVGSLAVLFKDRLFIKEKDVEISGDYLDADLMNQGRVLVGFSSGIWVVGDSVTRLKIEAARFVKWANGFTNCVYVVQDKGVSLYNIVSFK